MTKVLVRYCRNATRGILQAQRNRLSVAYDSPDRVLLARHWQAEGQVRYGVACRVLTKPTELGSEQR